MKVEQAGFVIFYPNEIQRKSMKSNLDSLSILNSIELHVGNSAKFQFGVLLRNSCLLTPPVNKGIEAY